jgi:glycerol kinase
MAGLGAPWWKPETRAVVAAMQETVEVGASEAQRWRAFVAAAAEL